MESIDRPFEIFVDLSEHNRSVKKPIVFEIRVVQRIEFNGFSRDGGNATKISPAGDFLEYPYILKFS